MGDNDPGGPGVNDKLRVRVRVGVPRVRRLPARKVLANGRAAEGVEIALE